VHLIRNDFQTFLERESWFRTCRLPFRRGYWFHGARGDGKTSVVRAMLNGSKLDGHSIALFCEKTDDYYFERTFQLAASNAPSLITLEDIDRPFPRILSQPAVTKVGLPRLLNCLDGLGAQEAVIVVATANDRGEYCELVRFKQNWIRGLGQRPDARALLSFGVLCIMAQKHTHGRSR
jgi:chaperone BCS1